jgi:hypothetical protein
MADRDSIETRLALLEHDMTTVMQVVEGVKLTASETARAHARVDRLGDRVTEAHDDVVELRTYIASVERRREVATADLKRDVLAAIADVKKDVDDLGNRVDGASAARITARGMVTVAALTGFAGLVTLVVGRALGIA